MVICHTCTPWHCPPGQVCVPSQVLRGRLCFFSEAIPRCEEIAHLHCAKRSAVQVSVAESTLLRNDKKGNDL